MATVIKGTSGADVLRGENDVFDNLVYGYGGNDTLTGGSDADNHLYGGEGNDLLSAGGLRDVLYGGTGDDTLRGLYSQAPKLYGGDGRDDLIAAKYAATLLDGGAGADRMRGGYQNDTFVVDNARDYIEERYGGTDTVRASVSYTLGANLENLTLTGAARTGSGNALANAIHGNGADNALSGLGGHDTLWGSQGDDTLTGGLGNDRLLGGSGDDTLIGGADGDTLKGGLGQDTLTSGEGYDTIVFDARPDGAAHVDEVTDFNPYADKITLARSAFGKIGGPGKLDDDAFRWGSKAVDASDRLIWNKAAGMLYYDPDGTGAAAKVAVAHFGAIDLSYHAFWVA